MFVYGSFAQDAEVEQGKSIVPEVLWALVVDYKALSVRAEADHDGTEEDMEAFIEKVETDHDMYVRDVMMLLGDKGAPTLDENAKLIEGDPVLFYNTNKYLVLMGEEQLYVIGEIEHDVIRTFHKVDEISQVQGWFARINGDLETGLFAQ